MKEVYKETINWGDDVFQKRSTYNPAKLIEPKELDDAVRWLASGTKSIIDFGCGSGGMLYRCISCNDVE